MKHDLSFLLLIDVVLLNLNVELVDINQPQTVTESISPAVTQNYNARAIANTTFSNCPLVKFVN